MSSWVCARCEVAFVTKDLCAPVCWCCDSMDDVNLGYFKNGGVVNNNQSLTQVYVGGIAVEVDETIRHIT